MAAAKKRASVARKKQATSARNAGVPKTVGQALEAELKVLAKLDKKLADSTLAATARALAHELDNARNSATSKAMCAKAIYDALDRLHDLAPEEKDKDALDDLAAKREARRARIAAS